MKNNATQGAFSAFARKLTLVVAFLGISAFAFAQSKVTGTVKDSAGEPIIGASVIVDGTTTGTTTAADGTYSLNVPKDAVLQVSFIGYETVSQAVVQALLDQRAEARKSKNWAESDRLRDEIAAAGWIVKDSKDGQSVTKK